MVFSTYMQVAYGDRESRRQGTAFLEPLPEHSSLSRGKSASVRWHVPRAEHFIRAFPDRRLSEVEPDDIANYLAGMGQKPTLMSWQFRQTVDAIQTLYSLVDTEWTFEPDWDF